jgi:hypothetical protein
VTHDESTGYRPGHQSVRRPAFAALLDACRLWLSRPSTGALVDPRLDWEKFGRLAFIHNLEPLLHHLRAEQKLKVNGIPASLEERWEKAYFDNFVFNTRALEIVQPLADACERQQLPIAFFKGPVIAARVFSDSALRVMVDLDLLCRENELPQLVGLARQSGFVGGDENAIHHLSFTHGEIPLLLELHFRAYDFLPRPNELLSRLLESAVSCSHGDFSFPALPPHLETALEIAHLVNHDLRVNLKPLLDLAAGIERLDDPTPLAETLSGWDLEPEAAVIADVLERLFAVPTSSLRATAPGDRLQEASSSIVQTAIDVVEYIDQQPQPALAEIAVRPGIRSKLEYLYQLLLPDARRIEAVSNEPQTRSTGGRLRHLGQTFRRGWGKLSRAGLASSPSSSIRRELYRRRQRS